MKLLTISPCVNVCQLDDDVCIGCGRHIDDVASWSNKTDEEKHQWWLQQDPQFIKGYEEDDHE